MTDDRERLERYLQWQRAKDAERSARRRRFGRVVILAVSLGAVAASVGGWLAERPRSTSAPAATTALGPEALSSDVVTKRQAPPAETVTGPAVERSPVERPVTAVERPRTAPPRPEVSGPPRRGVSAGKLNPKPPPPPAGAGQTSAPRASPSPPEPAPSATSPPPDREAITRNVIDSTPAPSDGPVSESVAAPPVTIEPPAAVPESPGAERTAAGPAPSALPGSPGAREVLRARVGRWVRAELQEFHDGVKREIDEFQSGVEKVRRLFRRRDARSSARPAPRATG